MKPPLSQRRRFKPTRRDLLCVIAQLQGLIGDALAAAQNDVSPERARPAERPPARPTGAPVEGGARTPSDGRGTNGGTNPSRRDLLEADLQRAVAEAAVRAVMEAA